jgi:outer membrane protein assembly factor BamB
MNEFKKRPLLKAAVQSVALIAALFSLIVCVLLVADHVRLTQMDPLNDPQLLQLREELARSTGSDEQVVAQIRTYDLYARRAFFSNHEQRRMGGWLLLGGAAVCFAGLKLSALFNPPLPKMEKTEAVNQGELNTLFRQLLAGAGVLLVGVSLFLAFAVQSDLAVVLAQKNQPVEAVPVIESVVTVEFKGAENWPSLRGPGNIGVAVFTNAPISWDVESGEGVLWKAEIPVHGFNSPIVWGKRVFMSGADEEGQEVFCFDADTGEQLWSTAVKTDEEFPEVSEDTGYAAPTMATDGSRVFAIFATGELVALDFDGAIVWQKSFGIPDNPYGLGSSLISDGTKLFVQYDHQDAQKVMAFDGATGALVWQTARKHISWASPALIKTEFGMRLILNDEALVTAYDPSTGKELWSVECLGGEVAPSPAFNGKDIIFVASEYAQATALKLTQDGAPEMLWQYDDYLPEIASPLAAENLVFIPTSAGDIVCLDATTGEVKWEQEFDEGFNSSPVLVGDRFYAIDVAGVVHIIEAKEKYNEIAAIEMGEAVFATPAFMDGRIYIRTDLDLYCVGK